MWKYMQDGQPGRGCGIPGSPMVALSFKAPALTGLRQLVSPLPSCGLVDPEDGSHCIYVLELE